jgi:serine O-acetyltransferase
MGERLFCNIRADLARARVDNVGPGWWNTYLGIFLKPGTMAVLTYRFSRWARGIRVPILRQALVVTAGVLRFAAEIVTGVSISPKANIGPGLVVHTTYGVFVGATTIGKNCFVQHGVVIAYGIRGIGDNVYFGPGAKAIGNATIGNNVIVAANSVVVNDVPDDTTVMGVPARISVARGRRLLFNYEGQLGDGVGAKPSAAMPGPQRD